MGFLKPEDLVRAVDITVMEPGFKPRLRFNKGFGLQGASLLAQMVKDLPAMWATLVLSLGQEDPLENEMAAHSSIPEEESGAPQSMG